MKASIKSANKSRLITLAAVAIVTLTLTSAIAMAHDAPTPPPYAGVKNPFPWDDAGAQAQGEKVYSRACSACHGLTGSNIAAANLGSADFSAKLKSGPDHSFWVLSEGALQNGMPPFKSSLAEDERWQVLTYIATLSQPQTAPAPPASGKPANTAGTLAMTVGDSPSSVSALAMTATLKDTDGKPVSGDTVKFFLKKDFFASGWMEIGEATSDKTGKAVFEYAPSEDGQIQVQSQWGGVTATSDFTVNVRSRSYRAEAGIRLPAIGPEIAVGLDLATAEAGMSSPTGGIRLPGGTFSWLLLVVAVIIAVWTTYFRVWRVVSVIPEAGRKEGVIVRVVPIAATVFVMVVGLMLAFVILHGPYTHLSLGR